MPEGWVRVRMQDVVSINPPRIKPDLEDRTPLVFVPMPKVAEDFRGIDVSGQRPFSSVKRGYTQFRPGDVLFAKITPCMENGKIAIVPEIQPPLGYGSTEFFVMRPRDDGIGRWIAYCVARSSFRQLARENMQGAVGQRRVPKVWLEDASVPLAPLPEQHRIVAKIESLFAKLDEGVAALKRAEANLERYRASVLKAGVEGRLTEQWRRENPPEETGGELLQRVLTERRRRWEEEQLAKFAAKGKKPPQNWKRRYKEPVLPDTRGLPELPEGWCWATVDQLAASMANGIYKKAEFYSANGTPCLRMYNIVEGELVLRDLKRMLLSEDELNRYGLKSGDLLINRVNSRELVGKAAAIPDGLGPIVFESKNIRLRPVGMGYQTRFLGYCFAVLAPAYFNRHSQQVVGMASISQQQIGRLVVPVPPSSEQRRIVTAVDRRKRSSARLEDTIEAKRRRSRALRQSILKRAFEGRLIPQNPADEPASALLERIRAAGEAERNKRTTGRRRASEPKRKRRSQVP